jgi:hypothetical protein
MNVVRYEPWTLVNRLSKDLDRLFNVQLENGDESRSSVVDWVPPVARHRRFAGYQGQERERRARNRDPQAGLGTAASNQRRDALRSEPLSASCSRPSRHDAGGVRIRSSPE